MNRTTVDRHKNKLLGLRLDPALVQQFRLIAKANRRTLTAEVSIALERHVENAKPRDAEAR